MFLLVSFLLSFYLAPLLLFFLCFIPKGFLVSITVICFTGSISPCLGDDFDSPISFLIIFLLYTFLYSKELCFSVVDIYPCFDVSPSCKINFFLIDLFYLVADGTFTFAISKLFVKLLSSLGTLVFFEGVVFCSRVSNPDEDKKCSHVV